MIAYKVMGYDPKTNRIYSGANNRLTYPKNIESITMEGQGIWLTLDKQYAIDYYSIHDYNVILELEFNPDLVLIGSIKDRETEFTVRTVKVISITHI